MGFAEPFTPAQFAQLKTVFIDCAKKCHANPERLFDEKWPAIKWAALECDRDLAKRKFYKSGEGDFSYSPTKCVPNRRVRQLRTAQRNRFRPLREAAKREDVRWLLDKHPEQADALLYGAIAVGVAEDHEGLARLTPSQLRQAVAIAVSPESILRGKGGNPGNTPIADYGMFLVGLYRELTGRVPNTGWYDYGARGRLDNPGWRGPSLRFFQAAMAPFGLKVTGIRSLIKRVRQGPPVAKSFPQRR